MWFSILWNVWYLWKLWRHHLLYSVVSYMLKTYALLYYCFIVTYSSVSATSDTLYLLTLNSGTVTFFGGSEDLCLLRCQNLKACRTWCFGNDISTAPPGVRCSLKSSVSSSPMLYLIMGGLANSSWFVLMPGAWTTRLACSFLII